MNYEDIILLVKAGYTRDQIAAMQAPAEPPAEPAQAAPAEPAQAAPAEPLSLIHISEPTRPY